MIIQKVLCSVGVTLPHITIIGTMGMLPQKAETWPRPMVRKKTVRFIAMALWTVDISMQISIDRQAITPNMEKSISLRVFAWL
mmetsp:Transcript_105133/g.250304  ORF Transcript_105133/g.250304 Transcript_105133/m.250304 type:complete len:83 (+) Transcript_105133:1027-1275(+)